MSEQALDIETGEPVNVRRINVAVSDGEVAAIKRLIDFYGISLTEAVRRLIGYGDFVHRAMTDEGKTLHARTPDGRTQDVVITDGKGFL